MQYTLICIKMSLNMTLFSAQPRGSWKWLQLPRPTWKKHVTCFSDSQTIPCSKTIVHIFNHKTQTVNVLQVITYLFKTLRITIQCYLIDTFSSHNTIMVNQVRKNYYQYSCGFVKHLSSLSCCTALSIIIFTTKKQATLHYIIQS